MWENVSHMNSMNLSWRTNVKYGRHFHHKTFIKTLFDDSEKAGDDTWLSSNKEMDE